MVDLFQEIKNKIFIIAEIGCNHNGDMAIAKELIDQALDCGVDAVKFQSFNPEKMTTTEAPKANYQIKATGTSESQYDRLCRMQLTRNNHFMLKDYCLKKEIQFISTPFDEESVYLLEELKVPLYKISSGEITNIPLLSLIGSMSKPVILSTGMSDTEEIEQAINTIGHRNIVLLHCISAYPAKWEEANLRAINTLKNTFNLPVGFSDHTEGIELALVAVGIGAVVIEKHITLDRNMEGGDHKASLEPENFKNLVQKIRKLEIALGDGIKRCMPSEKNVSDVARKSLVAKKVIKHGETISPNALVIKRPGTGIPPKYLEKVIGSTAKMDILEDQIITWEQIDLEN
jgi:N,N'-diacetyllegionaminate synthase